MDHAFTVGVEEEFQIVDPDTWELRSHDPGMVSEHTLTQIRVSEHKRVPHTRTGGNDPTDFDA